MSQHLMAKNEIPQTLLQVSDDIKYSARRLENQAAELVNLLYGEQQPDCADSKIGSAISVYSNLTTTSVTLIEAERILQSLIERIRGL